ncbi:unnamed protein product [Boreogadus saida]
MLDCSPVCLVVLGSGEKRGAPFVMSGSPRPVVTVVFHENLEESQCATASLELFIFLDQGGVSEQVFSVELIDSECVHAGLGACLLTIKSHHQWISDNMIKHGSKT